MNDENKTMEHSFPPEIYERAKAAKTEVMTFASEIKNSTNLAFSNPKDFSALESAVSELNTDARIVIGLGKFNWNKGHWDFDVPSTRAVMTRMSNLSNPDRKGNIASDYLELHIKYEEISTKTREGFRHHTVMHNIYQGGYLPEEDEADDAE